MPGLGQEPKRTGTGKAGQCLAKSDKRRCFALPDVDADPGKGNPPLVRVKTQRSGTDERSGI
jgi:hypothetical protein